MQDFIISSLYEREPSSSTESPAIGLRSETAVVITQELKGGNWVKT